ncbi:hypothetical protein [Mesorhizobium opportunistum]|uniref:hypothetical protein n=1 Tax=Mesorhizobium opportunistum TaxID=593909 RepID=UPI001427D541|nr:hypothetical protein [Mesorhizobium opportunistum]
MTSRRVGDSDIADIISSSVVFYTDSNWKIYIRGAQVYRTMVSAILSGQSEKIVKSSAAVTISFPDVRSVYYSGKYNRYASIPSSDDHDADRRGAATPSPEHYKLR